jgi:HAD superfamily hydrolase (TIGR01509 family)
MRSPFKWTAVITDVDGTLYRPAPVRRYAAAKIFRFGMSNPWMAWRVARALAAFRKAQEELRRGDLPNAAHLQVRYTARRTGYEETFIQQCVERWMNTEPLPSLAQSIRPGVERFLCWARAEGIGLAAVSDYEAGRKLRAMGIEQYFSAVVCAQDKEAGLFKPNPRGLVLALDRLGVNPAEAIYVGDRLEVDGAAAKAAGMTGVIVSTRTVHCPPGVIHVKNWFELQKLIDTPNDLGSELSTEGNH